MPQFVQHEEMDHGLGLPQAYNFRQYLEREQAFMREAGEAEEEEAPSTDDPYANEGNYTATIKPEAPKKKKVEVAPTALAPVAPAKVAPPAPVPQEEGGKLTFTISPENIQLELIFNLDAESTAAEEKSVRIRMKAISFEDNRDGITFMTDKSVDVDLPVLLPFCIKVVNSGRIYWVLYVGGSCMIGTYKFVSLVKTKPPIYGKGRNGSNNGEAGES